MACRGGVPVAALLGCTSPLLGIHNAAKVRQAMRCSTPEGRQAGVAGALRGVGSGGQQQLHGGGVAIEGSAVYGQHACKMGAGDRLR